MLSSLRFRSSCVKEDGWIHFSEGTQFKKCQELAAKEHCLPVVLIGNRDDFPGFLFSNCSLKGYYFALGNLSYPEIVRNVCVFAVGLNCEECKHIVEMEFVKNLNRLNETAFFIYHSLLGEYIRVKLFLACETDDSPEAAYMKMCKGPTAIVGCHECKESSKNYLEGSIAEKKSLKDSEEKYNECSDLLEDGEKSKITKLEQVNGYSFTRTVMNKETKKNET